MGCQEVPLCASTDHLLSRYPSFPVSRVSQPGQPRLRPSNEHNTTSSNLLLLHSPLTLPGWQGGAALCCAPHSHPPTRARRDALFIQARAFRFSPPCPKRSRQTVLHCAHRTSTASSCAFCEQEGWSGGSPPTLLRPRVPRAKRALLIASHSHHIPSQSNTAPPHQHREDPAQVVCRHRQPNR